MTLSAHEVETLLLALDRDLQKGECRSCECLQGYLAQLKLDADEGAADLIDAWKVAPDVMHACPGCFPCVPGKIHTRYLRRAKSTADEGKD